MEVQSRRWIGGRAGPGSLGNGAFIAGDALFRGDPGIQQFPALGSTTPSLVGLPLVAGAGKLLEHEDRAQDDSEKHDRSSCQTVEHFPAPGWWPAKGAAQIAQVDQPSRHGPLPMQHRCPAELRRQRLPQLTVRPQVAMLGAASLGKGMLQKGNVAWDGIGAKVHRGEGTGD